MIVKIEDVQHWYQAVRAIHDDDLPWESKASEIFDTGLLEIIMEDTLVPYPDHNQSDKSRVKMLLDSLQKKLDYLKELEQNA